MSYARFGYEDSDVYVFLAVEGHLECCACLLGATPERPGGVTARFANTAEMIDHLKAHRLQSHTVPGSTLDDLRRDGAENDAFILTKTTEGHTTP